MRDLMELEKYRLRDAERKIFAVNGDSRNGVFRVHIGGRSFIVVASNGCGWEHVSASPCSNKRNNCPTWEEMCGIKDMFFLPEERVVQYHPPKSEYVNQHPYCLHLWRPTADKMPYPPTIFV